MKCHGREPFVGDDVADDGNADNNLSGKKESKFIHGTIYVPCYDEGGG